MGATVFGKESSSRKRTWRMRRKAGISPAVARLAGTGRRQRAGQD